MLSSYSEGFNTKSIDKIISFIANSKYKPDSLLTDLQKIIPGKSDGIQNTINLLLDCQIIQTKNSFFVVREIFNKEQIQKLIIEKFSKDGLFEKFGNIIESRDGKDFINLNLLYFAKMSGLLSIFLYLDIIQQSSGQFLVNPKKNYFKKFIIKSPEQLKREIEEQAIRGNLAEESVLKYEKQRLKNHPEINRISRVSEENVMLGYDIESYISIDSKNIDKFIEVKSFSGSERFFWSLNEINVAQAKGDNYFLIIVNSDKYEEENFKYREIQNPYKFFNMRSIILKNSHESYEIQPYNFLISL